MIVAMLAVPIGAGLIAFFVRRAALLNLLLIGAPLALLGLVGATWIAPPAPAGPWLGLDAPGLLFLTITALLAVAASIHATWYLKHEASPSCLSRSVFTGCALLFIGSMALVPMARHVGLLWVAIEATTLASAPLVYFHRDRRSLDAAWKYLLVCSIGIALALLGNFFLAAALPAHNEGMTFDGLVAAAPLMNPLLLKIAAIFLFVGYGTKMGLAPMHTWLPDAHSEAPSPVSALLSGALLNGAFLALLRIHQVLVAANLAHFSRTLFLGFGLLSMTVAALFIIRQADYKRLLAYSSVEHVGILAIGVGIGGAGLAAGLLHAVNHSLAKAMLFLTAGNILAATGTKRVREVRNLARTRPVTAALWIAGLLAITGSPPFGTFLSEFAILKAAVDSGRYLVAVALVALLVVIFIAMMDLFLRMVQGPDEDGPPRARGPEAAASILPPLFLGLACLALGIVLPEGLRNLLAAATRLIEGGL